MSRNSRRQRDTITPEEVTRVDAFEPDYETTCVSCGQSPTVVGVKDGKVVYAAGLCGACTWGEADAIDPANW